MRTPEQRAITNRANAQKSTGPRTALGKQISSRNALRHGLLSNVILIEGESRSRFADLLSDLHAEFQPLTANEHALIENMAVARWRLLRVWAIEAAGITHQLRHLDEAGIAGLPIGDAEKEDPPTRAMLALRALSERGNHFDNLSRAETRFDRQYHRALNQFTHLRQERQKAENKKMSKRSHQLVENKESA